jgi:polyisoprenoid-binding protein YceI
MKSFIWILAGLLPVFASAAPVPLIIDTDQSRVEVVVKATVDSFTGQLATYLPEVTVDAGRVTAAKIDFKFADVRTGKDARDEAMHDWQETAKHPLGSYVLTSITPDSEGRLVALGKLTFHGVTRDITFPVSVTTDRTLYAIDGEAALDTREFGLPVIRKFMVLKVDPVVKVRFHLQGSVKLPSSS